MLTFFKYETELNKCKTNPIKWCDLKATAAIKYLRNFPKCGVRYAHINGHSLVLVKHGIRDQALIAEKRNAATRSRPTKTVSIVEIPMAIAVAAGL